jgi:hypothetical protein
MRAAAVSFLVAGLLTAAAPQEPKPFPARIDEEVAKIPGSRTPAEVCSDGEFLRRVMLDLVGYPPTGDELLVFAADRSPDKRAAKVDELLATDRFNDFWARRWMSVFFGNYHAFRREPLSALPPDEAATLMESFRRWMKNRLRADRSWVDTVRDLLEAEGDALTSPQVVYKLATIEWPRVPRFENRAMAHFMGMDFSCTGCHDHPFDKWRVEDGYSLMAFSSGRRLSRGLRGFEIQETPGFPERRVRIPGLSDWERQPLYAAPRFPDGKGPAEGEVLAKAFARLVTARDNPQFRWAAVNRVWTWLTGRAIVLDGDFNLKNKPRSPGLLKLLADEFTAHDHSFKCLIRAICASDTYRRRTEGVGSPSGNAARGAIRPLSAEQILCSLEVATRGRPSFDVDRAQALAERLIRGDAPVCEVAEVRIDARALLWLSTSEEVRAMVRDGTVTARIRKSANPVREMFLSALSREPESSEAARVDAYVKERGPEGLDEAYLMLLNTSEFLTRH